mgnify:CR=1 FL=1
MEDEVAFNVMADCIHDLRYWMTENRLTSLNDDIMLILIDTKQQLEKVDFNSITVGITWVMVFVACH